MSQPFLRTALNNIHRDPFWWRTVLRGGAYMLTIFGWPLASGLVVENMENATKGYPTPLPPWIDLGTRYIIGLFALLIDFVLFLLPLFVGGGLLICSMVVTLIGTGGGERGNSAFQIIAFSLLGIVVLFELTLFLGGAAPMSRLKYIEEGHIEEAIGGRPFIEALRSPNRGVYMRARLASLPGYIPLIVILFVAWGLTLVSFSGQIIVFLLLIWLIFSALLYAHLVVGQVYTLAEQDVQRAEMEARMARRS